MAVGLSSANFTDLVLTALDGAAATLTASHVQAHTADPGVAGTTAVATAVTGRQALTWAAASGTDPRSRSISNSPSWTASATQTITHVSVWNAASSGLFRFSAALAASKTVNSGDTLSLTALSVSFAPIAA